MTTDPNDTRPTAHRVTVTPETLRRAEALGWTPGEGDVLLWALRTAEGWREEWQRADAAAMALAETVAQVTDQRDTARSVLDRLTSSIEANGWRQVEEACSGCRGRGRVVYGSTSTWGGGIGGQAMTVGVCSDCWGTGDAANPGPDLRSAARAWKALEANRDAARRDLARIVKACGWDCDGNDPETPTGAIHLYGDAVQAVRELVEERAEDSREIVLLHRLCSEAADMLNEPTSTGGDAMDAMADRLRAAADEKPPRPICGVVVRERVTCTMTARTLCPLPPGHDGDHAEALAGGDTNDRSTP